MHRPTRQHHHLSTKLALATSRKAAANKKKAGKRLKRLKKWVEQYQPLVQA